MEAKVIVVCVAVGFLGLLSAAMGFAAEAEKIKISDVQITTTGQCIYPKSPALALGLTSVVALVIAQAVINTTAGCICCKKNPHASDSHRNIALISFFLSWMTFIVAFLLLLTGAALSNEFGREKLYFDNYCYVVKPGVFSGGAVMVLASIALAIIYYAVSSAWKNTLQAQQNQGIAMGKPRIPPHTTQPVFVHEDTYNRQQFP